MVVTVILTSTITPRVSPRSKSDYRVAEERNVEEFYPSLIILPHCLHALIKGCAKHGGMPDIEERVLGVKEKRRGKNIRGKSAKQSRLMV